MISPDRDRLAYPLTLGKVGSLALVFQPSSSAWSLGFEDLDRGSMFTICLYQKSLLHVSLSPLSDHRSDLLTPSRVSS